MSCVFPQLHLIIFNVNYMSDIFNHQEEKRITQFYLNLEMTSNVNSIYMSLSIENTQP